MAFGSGEATIGIQVSPARRGNPTAPRHPGQLRSTCGEGGETRTRPAALVTPRNFELSPGSLLEPRAEESITLRGKPRQPRSTRGAGGPGGPPSPADIDLGPGPPGAKAERVGAGSGLVLTPAGSGGEGREGLRRGARAGLGAPRRGRSVGDPGAAGRPGRAGRQGRAARLLTVVLVEAGGYTAGGSWRRPPHPASGGRWSGPLRRALRPPRPEVSDVRAYWTCPACGAPSVFNRRRAHWREGLALSGRMAP
ncbi:hypothetical protein P7K49_012207 [Saguinus oedipus]|uniref:Uncharacterized protein n=1 Tax=Saguinus oedipus TaxID=9490 RepID=A0ABQ9VSV3_SAGOE|nr:hypothetical protein P7K49_012207 [Saguinus oedipus]